MDATSSWESLAASQVPLLCLTTINQEKYKNDEKHNINHNLGTFVFDTHRVFDTWSTSSRYLPLLAQFERTPHIQHHLVQLKLVLSMPRNSELPAHVQ